MESLEVMRTISWVAVGLLSISYWFQIIKIQIHKEVRDLSIIYHVCLAIGFGILTWTAWVEDSTIFFVKQVATTVPVIIIICQIIYHKNDSWHHKKAPDCLQCRNHLELAWSFCAYCGSQKGSNGSDEKLSKL
jgi:hypothetical protein